jgi:exopolysaccharide production protein ExoY
MIMQSGLRTDRVVDVAAVARSIIDSLYRPSVTRLADIAVSLIAIVLLAPLLIVVAILVTATDAGPALFGHKRLGQGGRSFACLKFRTMVVDAEVRLAAHLAADPAARAEWETSQKLRHDPRVTVLGRFLRRTSIDELPQLINILRGEMSLVGPRPIVQAEVSRYGRYINAYYSVKPGVTGLWQVTGRGESSYRRRVVLDLAYIRSRSVRLNFAIMFLTVPRVLFGAGSY